MPLGIICSFFLKSERRMLQRHHRNFLHNLDLSLLLFLFLSLIFLPQVCFKLSFSIIISLFMSTPSVMFMSPLKNQLSFFEFVFVQVQKTSQHSYSKFVCVQVQETRDVSSLSFSFCPPQMPLFMFCVPFQENNIDAITYVLCAFLKRQHLPSPTLYVLFQEDNVNATITNIPSSILCVCPCIVFYQHMSMNA